MTLFDDLGPGPPPGDRGPRVRVKLVVAYDGAAFHGFAPNPGVATVGGTLATTLQRILREPVEVTCAGRTDTGVHAWGQVVTFDAPARAVEPEALVKSVNALCAPDVVVRHCAVVTADFDARFSARSRRYRYTVVNEPTPDPFRAATAWHVAPRLDLTAMRLGADALIGEHDFSSFCRRPKGGPEQPAPSMTRRVLDARWAEIPDDTGQRILQFRVEANAFCHQMVRSMVGTLVDVGLGRIGAGQIRQIIGARDRQAAGRVAPPHGLCLWEVCY